MCGNYQNSAAAMVAPPVFPLTTATVKTASKLPFLHLRGALHRMGASSTHGEFRVAEKRGHFIQRDQPDLVIAAIHDMISRTQSTRR